MTDEQSTSTSEPMSARDLIPLASGRGAGEWAEICRHADRRQQAYLQELRRLDFKAAMPNDGWVNWKTRELYLAYPWISGKLQPGDMVALGSASDEHIHYVRIAERASVNRSMLTWLTFDYVCKVTTDSLLPQEFRTVVPAQEDKTNAVILAFLILIVILFVATHP